MNLKYPNIEKLMDKGEPVCISFEQKQGESYNLLYCEMVHKARFGESFSISSQKCIPGNYILGISDQSPADYYLKSGRYKNAQITTKVVNNLPQLKKQFNSIKIEPLSVNENKFDVLILYLNPEKAMKIIQAYAYSTGDRLCIDTLGAGSICGDVTNIPLLNKIGLSFGCKGSRKHSGYTNEEVPLGIKFEEIVKIEEGLRKIPQTFD